MTTVHPDEDPMGAASSVGLPVKAMKTFRVVWEIDIDAETPEDAAHQALEIQRDEENTAVVFDVIDGENKQRVRIDLLTGVATGGTA